MTQLKLTFFDVNYGRGEAVRLALTFGNLAFEDDRITHARWPEFKGQQPFGTLPVLYVNGVPLSESNAICRYVGRLTNNYPTDPWQAAICDQVMEAVEDIIVQLISTISLSNEEKKTKRTALVENEFSVYLTAIEKILKDGGGTYISSRRMTVADLRVFDIVQWLRSGIDHIPVDFVDKKAPLLVKHAEMVKNEPRIKAYYDKREA